MAESKEELKSLLDEGERGKWENWLKTQRSKTQDPIQSHHFMQREGETMETVTDFIWGGSKITADGDCSQEIKRCLLLERKAMTNLDSILKSRLFFLPKKVQLVKAMFFPVVMYGCECRVLKISWMPKYWCFWSVVLKTLESPLDNKKVNQSNIKEISPEYSLEGLMLKLKLQYFGHLM